MRVKWTPQYHGKGPRDLEALIYKGEDEQWHWEIWCDEDYNTLANGVSYDCGEARIQATNAMRNIVHFETSELQRGY